MFTFITEEVLYLSPVTNKTVFVCGVYVKSKWLLLPPLEDVFCLDCLTQWVHWLSRTHYNIRAYLVWLSLEADQSPNKHYVLGLYYIWRDKKYKRNNRFGYKFIYSAPINRSNEEETSWGWARAVLRQGLILYSPMKRDHLEFYTFFYQKVSAA